MLTMVLNVESIFFKMYFFFSKSALQSSAMFGFWNKLNRNIMIEPFGQPSGGQLQNSFWNRCFDQLQNIYICMQMAPWRRLISAYYLQIFNTLGKLFILKIIEVHYRLHANLYNYFCIITLSKYFFMTLSVCM